MTYTRTLAQLRTGVQQLGGYENSSDITAAVLLQYVNDAIESTYNICIACRDDFYVIQGPSFSLVANQQAYALPTDFYALRKVELLYTAGRWIKLLPTTIDAANSWTLTPANNRYRYVISNRGISFYPLPSNVATVRVYYTPLPPQLLNDSDSVTFDRPVEQKLVEHIALRDCYQREDLSTSELDQKIERYTMELRSVADTHDDGEPFFLDERGPTPDGQGWSY